MKKNLKTICGVLASLCFLLTGCNNISIGEQDNSKYGTLTVGGGDDSRSMEISSIASVKISVTGSDFTKVYTGTGSGSGGKFSGSVNGIPVGKNRVVTVQALDSDGAEITGWVLTNIKDISGGNNEVTINWNTTVKGNAYSALLDNGVKIASLSSDAAAKIDAALPSVKGYYFDAEAFAADFGTDGSGLKTAADYTLKSCDVTFKASNAAGYSVLINDPESSALTVSSDGTCTISGVAPGFWNMYFNDGTKSTLKGCVSVEGDGNTVDSGFTIGTFNGIQIQVLKSLNYPKVHYFDCNDKTKYANTDWPGVDMLTDWNDEYYIYNFEDITQISVLITNSLGSKLYGSDMILKTSDSNAFVISGTGAAKSTYIEKKVSVPSISAKYSSGKVTLTSSVDVTSASVKVSGGSGSKTVSDFTDKTAEVDVSEWGLAEGDVISVSGKINGTAVKASCTVTSFNGVKIYVSSDSAPVVWGWTESVKNITNASAWPGETMTSATDLIYNKGWFVITTTLDSSNTETIEMMLNGDNSKTYSTGKSATFWYDLAGVSGTAGTYYDADPTKVPDPVAPTLTISPESGKVIGTAASIKISADFGYETPTVAKVTINGTESALKEGSNTFPVKNYATEAGKTITVSGTVTNSKGTATVSATYTTKVTAEDPFTWDNVDCYFVIPDRFYNGNTTNDHPYQNSNVTASGRPATDPDGYNIGTFHGGDIAGLTKKMDYFKALGVNAIWITAPYEQIHGWCGGGSGGEFLHYAYHGYYVLDYTEMDQNMGTVSEFRTFVDTCHANGIRVVMDIVMNHTGYENMQDMQEYGYGSLSSGGSFLWTRPDGGKWHDKPIDKTGSNWDKFWGTDWIRGEFNGYETGSGDLGKCLDSLPDFKTESTAAVSAPPLLKTKWAKETTGYDDWIIPAAKDLRADLNLAPTVYVEKWLAAWVREFGIDGFRCDTAKHVDMYRWGELKKAGQAALEEWRNDTTRSASSIAKDWDESFWMTAENNPYYSTGGNNDWYKADKGGFDSMINFSFQGGCPTADSWSSYISINSNVDSDGNGNRDNVLSYISSHDSTLSRGTDGTTVGTYLTLLPGGVQIFYGDESSRKFGATGSDSTQGTRSDMNWSDGSISGTGSISNADQVAHWGKIGNFRKYNPAVGAGTGTAYKRTYSGAAGESKVAIGIDGTSVDVSGLFDDGTTVYNWYDGKSAAVSGGTVTFSGGTVKQPILVSEKNPADYGLTF